MFINTQEKEKEKKCLFPDFNVPVCNGSVSAVNRWTGSHRIALKHIQKNPRIPGRLQGKGKGKQKWK